MIRRSVLADRVQGVAIIGTGLCIGGAIISTAPMAILGLVIALIGWPTYAIVRAIENREEWRL